jgi:hypothetical protein
LVIGGKPAGRQAEIRIRVEALRFVRSAPFGELRIPDSGPLISTFRRKTPKIRHYVPRFPSFGFDSLVKTRSIPPRLRGSADNPVFTDIHGGLPR